MNSHLIIIGGLGNRTSYFNRLIECLHKNNQYVFFIELPHLIANPHVVNSIMENLKGYIHLCLFSASYFFVGRDVLNHSRVHIILMDPPHSLYFPGPIKTVSKLYNSIPTASNWFHTLIQTSPGLRKMICSCLYHTIDRSCPMIVNDAILSTNYNLVKMVLGKCEKYPLVGVSKNDIIILSSSSSSYHTYHRTLASVLDNVYIKTIPNEHGHHFSYYVPSQTSDYIVSCMKSKSFF